MNPRLTMLTAGRVLRQIRADHRTIALLLIVPCVLLGLLAWIFEGTPAFDRVGPALLGVFPFVVMFIVTSVATLRERTSGTLERLLAGPLGKADFMFGYALAFGFMAIIQALVATAFAVWVCGLDVAGPKVAARRHRGARRRPRRGFGTAGECLRAHRVPGGSVHACLRVAPVSAVRAPRRTRPIAGHPRRTFRSASPLVCRGRDVLGQSPFRTE